MLNNLLKAAEELSDAAGRVINNTGLADLESSISSLNLKLVQYDKAVIEMKKSTCGSCPIPCGTEHCCMKEDNEKKDENN